MRFGFIQTEKALYPVRLLCRTLAVSPAGFYAWCRRGPSLRSRDDAALKVEIRASHAASGKRYGSPRIHADIKAGDQRVGRKRVARLMREEGLAGARKRRFRVTTDSRHSHLVAPNSSSGTSRRTRPTRCGSPTSPTSGLEKAGCTWPRSWTCTRGGSSAGRWIRTSIAASPSTLWGWP
jgi:transposase InsO family protein